MSETEKNPYVMFMREQDDPERDDSPGLDKLITVLKTERLQKQYPDLLEDTTVAFLYKRILFLEVQIENMQRRISTVEGLTIP